MPKLLIALFCLLAAAFSSLCAHPAYAQSEPSAPGATIATPQVTAPNPGTTPAAESANSDAATQIAGWNRVLDSIQQGLDREGVTNEQLGQFSDDATDISRQAAALIGTLTPKVAELRKQVDQLGQAPAEGEATEGAALAAKRATLQEALTGVDGPLREARLIVVRADQINAAALSKRRDRFLRQLMEHSYSVLDPDLWRETAAGVPSSMRSLVLHVRESMSATFKRSGERPGDLLALVLQIAAGAIILWYLRRYIRRHLGALPTPSERQNDAKQSLTQLAGRHLSDFLRNGILPAILLVFLARLLSGSELVADRFDHLVRNTLLAVGVVVVAFALLRVFLRPALPQLRIADLSDEAARGVFAVATLGLAVAATLHTLNVAAALLLAPFEISLALSALFALVTIVSTAWSLVIISQDDPERPRSGSDAVLLRWSNIRALLWLAVAIGTGGLLFGYIGLAEFVAYQIIMALIVIAVIWLTMTWIDEARQAVTAPAPVARGASRRSLRISKTGRQVAIVGFGVLRLAIFALAVVALLAPWGVRTADWLVLLNRAFFGFEVGDLTISFSSILLALILFVTGAAITRAIQHWIATQLLPTTKLDTGLRNSITTVLGYIGFVLAGVLAVGATGLDLSSIAIVVGALSVGIGLGLQGIVNNFVSGLILLAERPIKVGDWVVTGGGEGMVRRISVRSTEIETFDQATVIVPNSTLISESLTNWTHRSKLGRVIITVGVGYSSDPERVRDILLQCAAEHPLILNNPEPMVFFMDFGSDALIFDLRVWVADILTGFGAKSDLRYAILKSLREAGIEIPFPQRDLHIKSGLEALGAPMQEMAAKPAAKRTAGRRAPGKP
ncbi:MAG: mechanosensitive ion channel family protein [Nitratireductor sp.]|nr:mechanosensitive ion channel family protein [Nitratireductor sp.]